MTIGPAPMIRMDLMSVRLGMLASRAGGCRPVVDQPHETLEKVVAVLRTGRGFRMVLHRKDRLALDLQPLIGVVEQRDMRGRGPGGQALRQDAEAVILAGDLDLAGGEGLDRMIGAAMADLHLGGPAPKCQAKQVLAEAGPEERHPPLAPLLKNPAQI